MKNKYIQSNEGFALLFTVLVIAVLALVITNVFNTTRKGTILSVAGIESLSAWYAADSAAECALYRFYKDPSGSIMYCNGVDIPIVKNRADQDSFYVRTSPFLYGKNMTCAQIIMRTGVPILSGVDTIYVNEIVARGFSSCDEYAGSIKFKPRADDPYLTERRIRVRYNPN